MNRIQHIVEPERLWLVWQPASPNRSGRMRRLVGEIVREQATDSAFLRYLDETDDFETARSEGFEGYPAFKVTVGKHTHGVLDAFMRRLPPRNREDFNEYLATHRLPDNVPYSNMALLAYTGGKLPGDGFEFCADLGEARPPFELVLEVAGFRYQQASAANLTLGEPVEFVPEPDNEFDQYAVAIHYNGQRIGYVGRAHIGAFHIWMERGYVVNAIIDRVNGKPERPLVYLFVTVR
jgi:hypothetical protein